MPRTLRQIKFVDLAHSKLDDGGVADLRRRRGEALIDVKSAQKVPQPKRTEEQKHTLVTLKDTLKTAQTQLKIAEEAASREFKNGINTMYADNGGDWPEANIEAIQQGVQDIIWRDTAIKLLVVLGDAPSMQATMFTQTQPKNRQSAKTFETMIPPLENAPVTEPFIF